MCPDARRPALRPTGRARSLGDRRSVTKARAETTTTETSAQPALGARGSVASGREARNSVAVAESRALRESWRSAAPWTRHQAGQPAPELRLPDVRTAAARIHWHTALVSLTLLDLTAQRWRSINSTVGVSQLICRGDIPVPIASTVIEHLKRSEDDGGHILLPSQALFRRGDAVQIVEGPFASCLGIYQETTDNDRVAILLEFLGRKARMVVDADLIAAA